ncbi:MAG TPA: LLM class flavin-dependent oxidoreductase [Candidatus Dormibacteraeota bacterium]|jgi:alkanesulfonate monooxygenase SsuD/methylene tetrahydromethanopterin reductase-like flavin-dependent oxidoreductase (luciferase family)
MRFGIFYEHQLLRPWEDGAEERLLNDALEQVVIADRIGIDHVWEVEHHFLEEYSHSSAPEVFLAAASQRTTRIRLGHGIVQLPPGFNHPARVAERIATLDLISGGRVDFGTGEAGSQMELGGFGVDREQKRAQWAEALDVVTRMMVEDPFAGHRGRFLSVPPRNVVPKPKQRPHPPLWVACSRRDTILLAARCGIGALSFSFVEPEEARRWVDDYHAIIASEECVPAGFAVNPNVAVVLPFMCHPDEATAIERGIDGAHFFGYSLAHYYVFGDHRPGVTDVWEEFQANRSRRGFTREIVSAGAAPLGMKLLERGLGSLRGAIGTPAQVRELLERYRAAGVDQVILVSQTGRTRHEHICESLELFGAEVLPHFAEQAEAEEAGKRERLGEHCERALRRRPPARPPGAVDPGGYVVSTTGEPWTHAAPSAGAGGIREALARGARSATRAALAAAVRGRSDAAVGRTVASPAGLWVLFQGMARSFRPERAGGFHGDIQYVLEDSRGGRAWYLRVEDGAARPRRGLAPVPALTFRMPAALFARIAAGEVRAERALIEGTLTVEGDLALAQRLPEMFGDVSGF